METPTLPADATPTDPSNAEADVTDHIKTDSEGNRKNTTTKSSSSSAKSSSSSTKSSSSSVKKSGVEEDDDDDYEIDWDENKDVSLTFNNNIGFQNLWILSNLFFKLATSPQVIVTTAEE